MINPLFLTPVGKRWNRQPFHDLSRGVVDVPVKFQLLILKTVRMHVEFTFFKWLTLYSQAPWGAVESSTPPRPAPESPWPVWEVWTSYLENCANALRQTETDRQTDNPLYRYRYTFTSIDFTSIMFHVHKFHVHCFPSMDFTSVRVATSVSMHYSKMNNCWVDFPNRGMGKEWRWIISINYYYLE